MLPGISPRGVHAVGVIELRKLLIKHVLSDATDDHVQELAAMEANPTAGGILGRRSTKIIGEKLGGVVAEDAMKDARIAPTQDSFPGTSGTRGSS